MICAHRTKDCTLANTKAGQSSHCLWLQRYRGQLKWQKWNAGGCCGLSPGDYIYHQAVTSPGWLPISSCEPEWISCANGATKLGAYSPVVMHNPPQTVVTSHRFQTQWELPVHTSCDCCTPASPQSNLANEPIISSWFCPLMSIQRTGKQPTSRGGPKTRVGTLGASWTKERRGSQPCSWGLLSFSH